MDSPLHFGVEEGKRVRMRVRPEEMWYNSLRREDVEMSVTINLPPALEKEAQGYTLLEGKTLEQMFLDYLKKEFERSRERQSTAGADEWESKFDEQVARSSANLKGSKPYRFNRADAYPEGEFA